MSWRPHIACILTWNNHAIIEVYKSPTHPIFYLPMGSYLGMEYHTQYQTHLHHLEVIQEGHHHPDLIPIHHFLTMLQGRNTIHCLDQA